MKERFGIEGHIWGDDITYGRPFGWHPHRHVILLTSRPLSAQEANDLGGAIVARLTQWSRQKGIPPPVAGANAWEPVQKTRAGGLALYVAGGTLEKTSGVSRDELRGIASEVARMDTKQGVEGRTPFQLLSDAYLKCMASGGDFDAFSLWSEYEEATAGRSAVRWSNGLRDRLGIKVTTDEEAAREVVPVEATEVEDIEVPADEWLTYVDAVPGREAALRIAFRDGGKPGLWTLLGSWRATGPPAGVGPPS